MTALPAQTVAQSSLTSWLGNEGRLAECLPGFSYRAEQLAMADRVAAAIADNRSLIVEAGTGVGKTFAYLLPALLAGKRIVISTGTRSLQDQLFKRDLPMLTSVVGRPVRIALLKGRGNYLCEHRLGLATVQAEARGLSRELAVALRRVGEWAQQTNKGDISELAAVAEAHPVWQWVTSTRDNCLGAECPVLEHCHVAAARRAALAADIVVVNHHLLLADLLLKEHGFGDLLPGADAIIVDEAHQLPEVATQAFGATLSARQLQEWVHDVVGEYALSKVVGITRAQMDLIQPLEQWVQQISQALAGLSDMLDASRWPDMVHDVLLDCRQVLRAFVESAGNVTDQPALSSLVERAEELALRGALFAADSTEGDTEINENQAVVRWATRNKAGFVLHHAPVEVAKPLGELIAKQGGAWIFTSATLAVEQDLGFFARRIGLPDAEQAQYGSPFNYVRQALLYLPDKLDMPSSLRHTEQVITTALPLIEASGGRCFLLFTSYRALRAAAEQLRTLWAFDPPYPLLVQGDAPRDLLLKQFRELGNAVLLGTGSFWEGVDVKGHALCVVVIDKLPFAVPDEPLTKARLTAIERRGGNAFMEESVPQAVVALKQGVGRLIRDANDFGVIMLCDRRLTTRSYGKFFLDSLPPMPRTTRADTACQFLRQRLSTTLESEV